MNMVRRLMFNSIKKEAYLTVFLFIINFLSQFYFHNKELTIITLLLIAILHARITQKVISFNPLFLDKRAKITRVSFLILMYLTFIFAYLFRVI